MIARRAWARRLAAVFACAAMLRLAQPARAADGEAPIPAAHGYVNDTAGILGESRAAELESYLDQLEKKAGVQFAVLTVNSTAPEDPEQYKVRAFKAWGIGGKGKDEGLLLLVAMQEHRMVFETGYGLEGTLPDGWEAGMLRDLAVPRFRAGQYADGVTAAVLAAAQRIAAEKGVTLTWTGEALRYDAPPGRRRGIPPILVAFIIFLILSSMLRGRRGGFFGGMGPWIGMGMGGWGGGFGGGGGGGGSSFGGFGGGSSGGGGGGAGW
jgi:uncharacterized protein